MPIQMSYSRWKTFERCRAKFKFSYIDKVPVTAISSPAADRGSLIHKTIEDYLNHACEEIHEDVRKNYGQWIMGLRNAGVKPEVKWAVRYDWTPCEFDAEDYWLRGVWDAILVKGKKATVFDWKTGREYPDHKDQSWLYAIAAFLTHPEVEEVTVHMVYVDAHRSQPRSYGRELLPAELEQWKIWLTQPETEELWPPKPDYSCRWCAFARENGGPCRL